MTKHFNFHPLAEIFPLMSDDEFQRLTDDIRTNGQREPIWIYQEKIIDGRNRYNACQVLKIEPTVREWDGTGSLISFVVSLNLHRRHLSESQRAMVGAKLANLSRGDNQFQSKEDSSIELSLTQDEASKLLNVSVASIKRAKQVLNDGVMELAEQVEAGELTVSRASEIASLPKTRQMNIIRRGRETGQKLLTDLKIKSLKKTAKEFKTPCLFCNPDAVASKSSVSAMMQLLAKKHPNFGRYFNAVVEELEEMDLADEVLADKDKILIAIHGGFKTFAEILSKTKIERDTLNYCLSLLLDYGEIEIVPQGGKSETARGARKLLYRICSQEI